MAGAKETIARRVAAELRDGELVNLGIGLPTLVPDYLPPGIAIILQSENGFAGLGPVTEHDPDLVNAGGAPAGIMPGGAFFDSLMSFSLIRGGHVNVTVLGALQVDGQGNLANWTVPGKMVPGMGGAMDLVAGAKKVIVAMEHTARDGSPKILDKCTLPLTGKGVVSMIVTELGVMRFRAEGLVLEEVAPGVEAADVVARTGARLVIDRNLTAMRGLSG